MKYAYEKSESGLPYLSNTLIIPGVAGAGKTSVVLSSVNNADEEIIVAGPTKTQATKLQQQLNKSKSYTFNELLETLLGTD
jgi:MinD superfamily P-loop ATPase